MKIINLLVFMLLAVSIVSSAWSPSYAAESGGSVTNPPAGSVSNPPFGSVSNPPSFSSSSALQNPLKNITSITGFFLAILDILLVFAIPFVVFFIIYAGFMYVTARGNPGQIAKAHQALLYALIGGVIIFGARLILSIIQGTVDSFIALGPLFFG